MVGFYRKLTKDKQSLKINSFSKINGSSLPPFTFFLEKVRPFQFCQVCPKSTMRVWICVKYSNMTLLCFKFASNSIRIGNQSSCVSFLFAPNKLVPINVTNFQLCFLFSFLSEAVVDLLFICYSNILSPKNFVWICYTISSRKNL